MLIPIAIACISAMVGLSNHPSIAHLLRSIDKHGLRHDIPDEMQRIKDSTSRTALVIDKEVSDMIAQSELIIKNAKKLDRPDMKKAIEDLEHSTAELKKLLMNSKSKKK